MADESLSEDVRDLAAYYANRCAAQFIATTRSLDRALFYRATALGKLDRPDEAFR